MDNSHKGRPPAALILIGATAALAVLAVIAVIAMRGDDTDASPVSPGASGGGTSSTPTTSGRTTADCGSFDESPEAEPITAPAAVWIRRGFVDIPTSVVNDGASINGPGVLEADEPLACFAHTPTGALFAATASAADALYPPSLAAWAREQVVGPGADELLVNAETVSPSATSDGRVIRIIGFRFLDCRARDRCSIELASTVTLPDGTNATSTGLAPMQWHDDDWRYFTDGSVATPRSISADDLESEGFIRWSR